MLLRSTIAVAALVTLIVGSAEAAPKGSKGSAPKASSAKAPKATGAKAPKATGTTKAAKAGTNVARTETGVAKSKKTAATTSTLADPIIGTGVSTTEINFTSGKVGEKLSKNSALRSKLETQLRALGYQGTVYQAGYGFKNSGQFNAALNNAQNHGLTFEQLKVQMTGLSVDSSGVVRRANLNPDGTVTMVPLAQVTNPAPTQSLGQAKKTVAAEIPVVAPRSANR
jgi:hypothetical protein